jgi:hypothetical protein
MTWVERMLTSHGFTVLSTEKLPILYSEHSIRRQLNVARSKLPLFKDRSLATSMGQAIDNLDGRMRSVVNNVSNRRIKQGQISLYIVRCCPPRNTQYVVDGLITYKHIFNIYTCILPPPYQTYIYK